MPNQESVTAAIEQFLAQFSSTDQTFVVALSGGADSVALLHALSTQTRTKRLKAIYIDHQLHADSARWGSICSDFCQEFGVDFEAITVSVETEVASLENSARVARYGAFKGLLNQEQCLLTGHHQDDQAETLLLQLFRGAGPKGLSAMPKVASFGQGLHARPLLSVSKQDILDYCQRHSLNFVVDPSNADLKHRRNFIRHEAFPLLQQEWPQLKETLARASQVQADTQEIVDERAKEDWEQNFKEGKGLKVESLRKLSSARQSSLLRYWFEKLGLGMPSTKLLHQTLTQMLDSNSDAQPTVEMEHGAIRRHQGFLVWVLSTENQSPEPIKPRSWDGKEDLYLADEAKVSAKWLQQNYPQLVGKELLVTQRQGGERFRKLNAGHSTSLKNYLQEQKIPTWERNQLLLIMLDGEVRAIYRGHLSRSS